MNLKRPAICLSAMAFLAFSSTGCVALLPLMDTEKSAELSSKVNPSCPYNVEFGSTKVRNQSGKNSSKSAKKMTKKQLAGILVKQLDDDNDVVRTHAATDLGNLGARNRSVVIALGRAAHYDKSKWVRRASVKSLAKIGGSDVVPLLKRALGDRNPWVVHSAKRALRRMSWKSARASVS